MESYLEEARYLKMSGEYKYNFRQGTMLCTLSRYSHSEHLLCSFSRIVIWFGVSKKILVSKVVKEPDVGQKHGQVRYLETQAMNKPARCNRF